MVKSKKSMLKLGIFSWYFYQVLNVIVSNIFMFLVIRNYCF
jgi:hypothetical protein